MYSPCNVIETILGIFYNYSYTRGFHSQWWPKTREKGEWAISRQNLNEYIGTKEQAGN